MKASEAYQGVVCYSGMPGSGKSYALVERAVQDLREGRRVFSNAGFEVHDVHGCGRRSERYFSLEELLTVPNGCTVLLDEAPVYVNSRKSAEFPRGLLYRMTQVRKDGLRFYYSSIDEMMVDANLRRVTFWTWQCRRSLLGFFRRTLWAPVDRRTAEDKKLGGRWLRLRRDVAEAYDTTSKVWIPPEVVAALLDDIRRGWVPLTDELVDVLWAGTRDPVRARELLEHYQQHGWNVEAAKGAEGPEAATVNGRNGRPQIAAPLRLLSLPVER